MPALLKPVQFDIRYVTVDYGLWEMRWWLPTRVAFHGTLRLGRMARFPVEYVRTYRGYRVRGEPEGRPPLPPVRIALAGDTLFDDCPACACQDGRCRWVDVRLPEDSTALLHAPQLPGSIFDDAPALLSRAEAEALGRRLKELPGAPWQRPRVQVHWPLERPTLTRYNRVEGLSLAGGVEVDAGRLGADATLRLGLADWVPGAELGVTRTTVAARHRLAAYYRLAAVDGSGTRTLGPGNSVNALLFGRDDGDYYRTAGAELIGEPAGVEAPWYRWRLYAERHRAAEVNTHFSVRRVLDDSHAFRPNVHARDADLLGARLTLRAAHGQDPRAPRLSAELDVDAAAGSHEFVRPALLLRLRAPLPLGLMAAAEAAGGAGFGRGPVQKHWFLGGPATLRGYPGAVVRGPAFWRARLELGTDLPAARVIVFGDAGWAGPRDRVRNASPLLSAGAGVSLLDGLIRFDLARALDTPGGWRADLYLDAPL